jgi:hypothetical protein
MKFANFFFIKEQRPCNANNEIPKKKQRPNANNAPALLINLAGAWISYLRSKMINKAQGRSY